VLTIALIECKSFVLISMEIASLFDAMLIFSADVRNLVSGFSAALIVCPTLDEISGERLSRVILILIFTLCSFKVYIICARSNFVIAF
jgi:hypothetical protein